ncbi:3-hydroxyacyl-ACP dehydratase FabZ [bacterium]|nr:3-hydroxyacyl-ACP dehydratase FabZ [bacterium]
MSISDTNNNSKVLLHNDILCLIPHRYPFLLIDKVTDLLVNKSAIGIKSVTYNEPFFIGHFPEYPVMPGVLIVESLAQTAACLISYSDKSLSKDKLVFFTGIEQAKFRKPVTPGCVLKLKINIVASKKTLYKFSGEAYVNNHLAASAEFSAMLVEKDKAV